VFHQYNFLPSTIGLLKKEKVTRFLEHLNMDVCKQFATASKYSGSCVALALCREDEHRKLVTRLGVIQRV